MTDSGTARQSLNTSAATGQTRAPAAEWLLPLTCVLAVLAVVQGFLYFAAGQMFALPSVDDTWLIPILLLVCSIVQLALGLAVLVAGRIVHRIVASIALLAIIVEIVVVIWLIVLLLSPGSFDF